MAFDSRYTLNDFCLINEIGIFWYIKDIGILSRMLGKKAYYLMKIKNKIKKGVKK